ncbi:MAG: hypothetical protein ABSG76_25545 [Xanthobacteraceae bacterium]|jgi:hypothetical protein
MTNSDLISVPGHEFDDFLFAPIREDGNGMLLSVLSALARLDIDPWQEAARLTRLSGEIATQRMASLIAALPDEPSTHPDARTTAARLIALLPQAPGPDIASGATSPGIGSTTAYRAVVMYVVFVAVVLGFQSMVASRQPPAAPADDAPAAFSSVIPSVPPASSGR